VVSLLIIVINYVSIIFKFSALSTMFYDPSLITCSMIGHSQKD